VNVRAARGAIVVPEDVPERLHAATGRLLGMLLERNGVAHDDLISILFTVTDDLRSAFPAEAARLRDRLAARGEAGAAGV